MNYSDPFGLWSLSLQGCSHGFAGICLNITVGRENGQTLVKVKAGVGVGGGVEFHPTDHIAGDGREAKGGAAHVGFVAGAGFGIAHAGASVEYHEGTTFYFHPEGGADKERVEGPEGSASLTSEKSLSAKASGIAGVDLELLTPTPKDGNDATSKVNP